ncbi:hypothetical protein GF367_03230 [Candidatus Woesearchaeota archaeon]|nr:hypothetical protein [Candidatus Woesearchaeota archaeon]
MVTRLVKSIKEKKEFSALPDAFVKEKTVAYLVEHKQRAERLEHNQYNEKSKEYKTAVKEMRASLREIHGVFQKATDRKRKKLLAQYWAAKGRGEKRKALDKLLQSHQSTNERRNHYASLYKELFTNEEPQHILDLGCGLNPLAYDWLPNRPAYTCCDISREETALINAFFAKKHVDGKASTCNLLRPETRKRLVTSPADTVLLFKMVDTLEAQERNSSKALITGMLQNKNIKRIIISFATKSIGGRTFRTGNQDNWFTEFLRQQRLGWHVTTTSNEEFYDVKQ